MDKISKARAHKYLEESKNKLSYLSFQNDIQLFSTKNKEGLRELEKTITNFLDF